MTFETNTFQALKPPETFTGFTEQANSLQEAGRRLCRSRASLYEMAGRGEIRFHKIGKRTVVMESEILRILREAPEAKIRTPLR